MQKEKFYYDNRIVKMFSIATVVWGIVGMLVGVIVATQMFYPEANLHKYLTFGRIRPLHTNAVIFAFVGNAIFAGVYYSLQRLLKTRMFSDTLSKIHFWGWQLIIVSAALTLPLGITAAKEYAELEWPIDIAIALIWVVFGWNMIGTILRRREKHLYVAIWFYLATFVTVAVLHIVNSIAIPVGFLKSYSAYAGVQDALVQWWYGHNAVAFFLTTPFLGLMYYFMPKMAKRPIYSYKLSILHFWSLIFLYIWAGPHHLLYSSLPDWAQTLGVIFSVMLIAPSWGGMLNGLLTLRGAWDKVRDNALLKFMVVGITCYGMSTFEGPMLSLKSFNKITHFTDWIPAHVHVGALGWNGFLTFAILYFIVPRIFNTTLFSKKAANTHFLIGTLGIILYVIPMYVAGWTQGQMWGAFQDNGQLQYGNFLETVTKIIPMYIMRAVGGLLYLVGVCLMAWNLIKTAKQGQLVANEEAEEFPMEKEHAPSKWHRKLERNPIRLTVFALLVILIGGLVEIVPMFLVKENVKTISSVRPYTPLELEGRDIYIREGCLACHSQLVRPFRWETERYGDYSKSGEFVYDHPFLWGSKRIGPDLSRSGVGVDDGGKIYKNAAWHYAHFIEPSQASPGTIMPSYAFLAEDDLNTSLLKKKISVHRTLGAEYPKGYENIAQEDLEKQANKIANDIRASFDGKDALPGLEKKEIIALIAYIHKLGSDIHPNETAQVNK